MALVATDSVPSPVKNQTYSIVKLLHGVYRFLNDRGKFYLSLLNVAERDGRMQCPEAQTLSGSVPGEKKEDENDK